MKELNLKTILEIVITTFAFVAFIIPFIKNIAFHVDAMDKPDKRKINTKIMPRLGGLGIFLGFLLGYMLFSKQSVQMNAILIGSFLIVLTGVMDDIKPLSAKTKLIGQVLATLVITLYGGIIINEISAFGIYMSFGIFAYPITILFIIAIINSINLIDGLDGLASGISAIFFLTIGIIAFITNQFGGLDVVLAFIMLGSTLGFLFHNFYPAKIFLGDTGSMFLGFIISIISLLGFKNVTLSSFIIPILILAVPILDTLFAIIRRTLKKQSFSVPDKEHIHHQLLKMNLSHRNTVLVIYLIDILFALTSIIYVLKDAKTGIILYLILLILVILVVSKTNIVFDKYKTKK
jgi:UDP-GlcNAc:undecaprenyl-phosphate/decaprenyl-phosphate GlcNAc-1-phosphate transferase